MPRTKVKLALIENKTERKASYKKRQKGFFKKAYELNTLCGVEIATVIYNPYHNEPEVFPNRDDAINTFRKFRELSVLDQSKNMVTTEEFTKQRIEKMKKQLQKLRKANRVKEFTNMMHEVLNGKDIPGQHPYDLNDLMYVMNQNLKWVCEALKAKADGEGSTSSVSQPIFESMVHSGTISKGPRAPLLATVGAPVSVEPSVVPGGTNFEGPSAPLLVPAVDPISMVPPMDPSLVPSIAPTQMPKPMFHLVAPLVEPSRVPPSPPLFPSFSSQMFPPMVLQMYPPMPQQMAFRRALGIAPPMPPTTLDSPIPSPMVAPPTSTPVSPPMAPQIDPSMNIPSTGASMPMNNCQNYSVDFAQSSALSEMLDWNDDDVMTLIDDPSFNNINVQDPNHDNNV